MGDDHERRNFQREYYSEIGSTIYKSGELSKEMLTRNAIEQKKKQQQGQELSQTEDMARSRLMGISLVVPPPSEVVAVDEGGTAPKDFSSPPAVDHTGDEIRRKLMSISYSEVDQPVENAG